MELDELAFRRLAEQLMDDCLRAGQLLGRGLGVVADGAAQDDQYRSSGQQPDHAGELCPADLAGSDLALVAGPEEHRAGAGYGNERAQTRHQQQRPQPQPGAALGGLQQQQLGQ